LKKKWLVFSSVAILAVALTTIAFAANPIKLIVNDQEIKPDVSPQIINGRTMVPIRSVAEALGARVDWKSKEVRIATDFFEALNKYVEETRPMLNSGELTMGWVPSKLEHKNSLSAVIALNHYLAELQFQSWNSWSEHPDKPVLVNYEILTPDEGGIYTPWYYKISTRLYWATFNRNPMANFELENIEGKTTRNSFTDVQPVKTWYENKIFEVSPIDGNNPQKDRITYENNANWNLVSYGTKGWVVKESEQPLPQDLPKEVDTKKLPMLFDIPYPPEYRGE